MNLMGVVYTQNIKTGERGEYGVRGGRETMCCINRQKTTVNGGSIKVDPSVRAGPDERNM